MKFISLIIFLWLSNSHALETGPYRIVGKVQSFDDRIVVVDSGVSLIEIPRTLVFEKQLKKEQVINVMLTPESRAQIITRERPNSRH